jgi:type IV pilus assembly protein PilW
MNAPARSRHRQGGVSLLELLVGLSIGLMTIAVALGALVLSRGVSGTVSDATQLQQQGAFALRAIGQQVRQAGSVRLNLAFAKPAGTASAPQTIDPADPVAFETSFDRAQGTLASDAGYPLQVGYQNYTEQVHNQASEQSLLGDCTGRQASNTVVQSDFRLLKAAGAAIGELQCAGADGTEHTLVGNVADFQVRYLLQTTSGNDAVVRRVDAAGVGSDWPAVVAVEVCLELVGDEGLDTAGATYRHCGWTSGQAETAMGNRLHMVFRNTFQLRAQGSAR